jgi:hypothetical protein
MMQSLLLLLAPAHEPPEISPNMARPAGLMATRLRPGGRHKRRIRIGERALQLLVITGNAFGFVVLLAGLGLVLRVAEVLMY